jgi:hypothetical protein
MDKTTRVDSIFFNGVLDNTRHALLAIPGGSQLSRGPGVGEGCFPAHFSLPQRKDYGMTARDFVNPYLWPLPVVVPHLAG